MAAKDTKVYADPDAAISFTENIMADANGIKEAVRRLIKLDEEIRAAWRTDEGKDEREFRSNLVRGYEQLLADADDLKLFAVNTVDAFREYVSLKDSVLSRVGELSDLTDPGNG